MIRVSKWLLLASLALGCGCTYDGEVRNIDGMYRKIYPDKELGGWYYVDGHGEKIHLNQLPDESSLDDSANIPDVR